MTHQQWDILLQTIDGAHMEPVPVGFIIDSPWLPNWAEMSILDYYASDSKWLEANLRAIRRFPDILFLPGFWSEWGMCTEPSAFGAKCVFHENEFPFAEKVIPGDPMTGTIDGLAAVPRPNPKTDGLAPFVLKRLQHAEPAIKEAGHAIRFAVARGPLNVAGFLMGNTEFLMAMKMQPDDTQALLETISDYLADWLKVQAAAFPSIDGVFILDDVVGFCGEDDFETFAKPHLTKVFQALDVSVRFFHNDAPGLVCAPHLSEIGVNLFNFAYDHPISEMKSLTKGQVTLLGNIPPRDVLAQGSPDDVRAAMSRLLVSVEDTTRIVLSCGGGMPPGVLTENIEAFLDAAGHHS
jgi:uroporphyrinogen-III decarboxylase